MWTLPMILAMKLGRGEKLTSFDPMRFLILEIQDVSTPKIDNRIQLL